MRNKEDRNAQRLDSPYSKLDDGEYINDHFLGANISKYVSVKHAVSNPNPHACD